MTNSFTPSDRRVRDDIRTQLDANICVEAGAGTGKTTVLVDRIVEVLRREHAAVAQLVVITFTEKAAAELASRVRRGLEDALRAAPDDAERDCLAAAIRGLNHAHIETIHAFAASLLRERPVEALMDPGFDVLDELPAQLAFSAAWDAWLTDELAQEPPSPALLNILDLNLDFRYVREAAERLNRHRYALPLRAYPAAPRDPKALLAALGEAAIRLRELDRRVGAFEDPARQAMPEYIERLEQLLELGAGSPALPHALASITFPATHLGNKQRWPRPSDCDAAKAGMKFVKGAIGEYVGALRSAATGDLVRWLEGFVRFFEQRRRRDGVADFDDLLLRARDLVRDAPEVRRYFQGKYRCILVDEFQDTDPVQAEMIVRLCAEDGGEADWRAATLRAGALFVVGDPKQSIYRFRRADITMYDEVKRGLFHGERAIVQNFRSATPIIGWINDVFGRMITASQGVQPAYVPLEHQPAFEAGAVALVRGTVAASAKIADVRSAEASALAGLIAREVNAGSWAVRGEGNGDPRPATWRDVGVLIPSRTELQIYEDAFARARIPYRHEGGRTFFLRQEVRELVAVLRAIDDPSDGVAAIAALRSAGFGCSDEDLFIHRSEGGRFDHAAPRRTGVASVTYALGTLHEFAEMRRTMALPDLVRAVLDRTRLVEFAMLQPHGDQVAANLLKMIDQARAFADAEGSGLRGFTRWLKDNVTRAADPRAGSGGDETDALISEDTDDVVRIMTVHAAKGLEFPVVVLANMCGERADLTNVIAVRDGAPGASLHMKLGKKDDGFRTPGYDEAEVTEDLHREAEEKRLLYVAATRAKDRLVVPFFDKDHGHAKRTELSKSLSGWLKSAGADQGEAIAAGTLPAGAADLPVWRGSIRSARPGDIARVLAERDAWLGAHEALVTEGNRQLRVRTATSMKAEMEPPWASDEQIRRSRAADFGTAVHALLERIDLRDHADLAERAQVVAVEFGMRERAGEIERVARNALGSPALDRARASKRFLREVAFTAPLPGDDGGFGEGRIDLLFLEDGANGPGIIVVDYKTDTIRPHELRARTESYRPQALVYAWAAAAATGLLVRAVVFLYARLPAESIVPVDAAFVAESERAMRSPVPA